MKKIKNSFLCLFFLCSTISKAEDGVYQTIAKSHLATLATRKKAIISSKKSSLNWKEKIKKAFISTTESHAVNPSDRELFEQIYTLFDKEIITQSNNVLNGNTQSDLEIISGAGNSQQSLTAIIGKDIATKSGKAYLHYLLSEPTDNITLLKKRQSIITYLLNNPIVTKELSDHLKTISTSEKELLNLWEEEKNEELVKEILKILYFDKDGTFKSLNKSIGFQHTNFWRDKITTPAQCLLITDAALMGFSLFMSFKPELSFKEKINLLPPLINQSKIFLQSISLKDKLMIGTGVAAVLLPFAAWQTYLVLPHSWKKNSIQKHLQKKLIYTANIINSMKALSDLIKEHPELDHNFSYSDDLANYFNTHSTVSNEMKDTLQLLQTSTFKDEASRASLHGRTVATFAKLTDCKNELIKGLHAIGEIDSYVAITELMNNHKDTRVNYNFVNFDSTATSPYIIVNDMWNPFVPEDVVVTNTIDLGNTNSRSGIITGPNAGGKSTALKGLSISVIMAQTVGIAPCTEMTFTPFAKISTYMNITDDISAGNSLFKSEVIRAGKLMKTVKETDADNKFSFAILDEVFCGTSPKEGAQASYSLAKQLGDITTNITLIATHFPEMTELEEKTSNYNNYQVRVDYKEDGSFAYRYKLEPGIADQNVAFELLKEEGFDLENFVIN